MKITNIISVILLSVYSVAAFSGIGIYNCNCTHTQRLVFLFVQPSCQCETSAESCCSHHDHQYADEHPDYEQIEPDDCCFLVFQHIDIDQLTVSQHYDFQAKVLSLFISPFVWIEHFAAGVNECFAVFKNHSPPPLFKIPLIYLQSQLRL